MLLNKKVIFVFSLFIGVNLTFSQSNLLNAKNPEEIGVKTLSQLDLDDATGNTNPVNNNVISLIYLDCNGIFSVQNYTVAGTNIIYPSGCTNDSLNILNFRYFKNDVEITSVVSTASLSSFCCI